MIVLPQSETSCKLPIKIWPVGDAMFQEDSANTIVTGLSHTRYPVFKQFRNLADHPLAQKWVCGMPDYHLGYGMPIGGVLATRGGVVPNAVGMDIGCGMIAERTGLAASDVSKDELAALVGAIRARVPVGFNHHTVSRSKELPRLPLTSVPVANAQWERAGLQVGTLGGGNHFIELQECEEDGSLWIMLHSGSRNIGKRVCDHYNKIAKDYMAKFHVDVDTDLAFLPDSVPEHDAYLAEMRWCMAFAEASRQLMLSEVHNAMSAVLGFESGTVSKACSDLRVDTHHNFAAMEHWDGENLMIHRKGAVKANGFVIIPGSMGTASYIAEGLEAPASFGTCSHGAGRVMGRKHANRTITHEQAVESMKDVVYGVRKGQYDETPLCYKDIDAVMVAQRDLAKPVYRLRPLAVVKG